MAVNVTTSAITNITEYPNSFKRQGAFPLERYSLFNSLADAQTYATSNAIAYVGQLIVVSLEKKLLTFTMDKSGMEVHVDTTRHVLTHTVDGEEVDCASYEEDNYTEGESITGITWTGAFASLDEGENGTDATFVNAAQAASVKAYIIGQNGTLVELPCSNETSQTSDDVSDLQDKMTAVANVTMPTKDTVTVYQLWEAINSIRSALIS